MNQINHVVFKKIHFEFDIQKIKEIVIKYDCYFILGSSYQPNTRIVNGCYFKWVYRVFTISGVYIDFVGEDVFLIENVKAFNLHNTKELAKQTCLNFNIWMNLNLKINGHPNPEKIIFEYESIDEKSIEDLLQSILNLS